MRTKSSVTALCVFAAGVAFVAAGTVAAVNVVQALAPTSVSVAERIDQGDEEMAARRVDAARASYSEAVKRASNTIDTARANDGMAVVLVAEKRYDEALPYARRAISAYESSYGDDSRSLGRVIGLLGDIQFQRRDFNSAKVAYERAVRILQNADGSTRSLETGCATRALGRCLIAMHRDDEAKPYMNESLRILEVAHAKHRSSSRLEHDQTDPKISGANAI
jgi:tetratricopeptide (TPR) repeat protein